MRVPLPLALSCLVFPYVSVLAQADGPAADSERLDTIVEQYYDRFLQLAPITGTHVGEDRYNGMLPDLLSEQSRAEERELYRWCLDSLRGVDEESLDEERRLTLILLRREAELGLQGMEHPSHLVPVSHAFTCLPILFPSLASTTSIQPFRTGADYDAFLLRLQAFPGWVDRAIGSMRKGMELGITQSRSSIERVLPVLAEEARGRGRSSSFWSPLDRLPEGIGKAERKRLEAAYRRVINDQVAPAYTRLHRFLKEEYLPHCRTSIGLAGLPGGKEWYRYLVRYYTTTELEPEEIFRIGCEEATRVVNAIAELVVRSGFEDNPQRFFSRLSRDPDLLIGSGDQLLEEYRRIGAVVEERLPELISLRPGAGLEIQPVDSALARSSPGAYYSGPRPGGGRPGIFFVRTSPPPFPRYAMESLYLHEAVPGHHLQITLAQELRHLPRYRRFLYQGAYIEGWALYAEGLGAQLGLYRDPIQEYGRLHMELLRSARLIADVAIHHRGWTREQVTTLLEERTLGVGVWEIDRYIAMPGQALGYKIGELRIGALRRKAEQALGKSFVLRDFHDELLCHGALPLDILEQVMEHWMAERKGEPGVTEDRSP